MVKPVVDFMQNYTQTPSRIYDLYQYYLGGGKSGAKCKSTTCWTDRNI